MREKVFYKYYIHFIGGGEEGITDYYDNFTDILNEYKVLKKSKNRISLWQEKHTIITTKIDLENLI